MILLQDRDNSTFFYQRVCIVMIWLIAIYSSIIQYAFIEIPHGMLIFGVAIIITYYMANAQQPFYYHKKIANESIYMLIFMVYMLIVGAFFSPDKSNHYAQWITCLEYLVLLIIISSLIKCSGTDSFYYLLFLEAIVLAIIFLRRPVDYQGRLSISQDMNPNGLGMSLAVGIWALLYIYHKKKLPLVIVFGIISILLYSVLLTGSRKSLIAAGLMILLWIVFCFIPITIQKGGYIGILKLGLMIVLVVGVGYAFMKMYNNSTIAGRMDKLLSETSEGKRSNMYRIGYELFLMNPLFGTGFQGFSYEYGTYSHATLVEIPVSGGLFGTLLYFGIYVYSIRKTISIYSTIKKQPEYSEYHVRIKMIIILWIVMLFYTTCIIHQYQFESFILFGIIFGDVAYMENIIHNKTEQTKIQKIKGKYFKV